MTPSDDILVAIDVGTSGARAAAFDLDGRRWLEVRRGYPTRQPHPGWAEQSPLDWRSAALGSLAELVRRVGPRRRVHAIGLTGQCPTIALLDARGRPLGPGLIYRDNRATAEAEAIRARYGDRGIHRRTGHLPSAFHISPKLLWLQANEPELWARATLAVQPRDWVVLALTGEAVTDGTHAAATLVLDLRGRRWDEGLMAELGLRPSLFPRVASSDEVVGTLRPAVAERVGLPSSTPVVLGSADSQACAFGAGVIGPGPVSEMAGSSTCLNAAIPEPLDVLEVTHYPNVLGDTFSTETGINTTGTAVGWIADRLYGGRRGRATVRDYERLDAEAAGVAPGSDDVLIVPVLADGDRDDPDLRGAITGLSLRHDRATLARATLEGVAYTMRAQLDLLRGGGAAVDELRVSGGDARLATWNRIKADVIGVPIRTVPGDAAVTGVAMLAGMGSGIYRDRHEAIARCVHLDPPIVPDPDTRGIHDRAFARHRELVAASVVRRQER